MFQGIYIQTHTRPHIPASNHISTRRAFTQARNLPASISPVYKMHRDQINKDAPGTPEQIVQRMKEQQQSRFMETRISQYMDTVQGQADLTTLHKQYLAKAAERSPDGVVSDALKSTIQNQALAFLRNQVKSKLLQNSMQTSAQQSNTQSNTRKMMRAETSGTLENDEGEGRGESSEASFVSGLISF